jgi:hypothetical protein
MVMKTNVECEIYISNMVNFFEKNPNDLIDMIGNEDKQRFYDKIREYVYKNFENGEDVPTLLINRNKFTPIKA